MAADNNKSGGHAQKQKSDEATKSIELRAEIKMLEYVLDWDCKCKSSELIIHLRDIKHEKEKLLDNEN